jgi:hypothetical protein
MRHVSVVCEVVWAKTVTLCQEGTYPPQSTYPLPYIKKKTATTSKADQQSTVKHNSTRHIRNAYYTKSGDVSRASSSSSFSVAYFVCCLVAFSAVVSQLKSRLQGEIENE